MKYKSNNTLFFAIVIAMVVVFVLVLLYVLGGDGNDTSDPQIEAGIAYLEALEQKDPADVQAVRKQIHQARLEAQRDALLKQLEDGTIDPFSLFKDFAIMGDSRAVGFWYHKFLDKGRCIADGGHTIRDITANINSTL